MIAPYIADLATVEPNLPIATFGVIALIARYFNLNSEEILCLHFHFPIENNSFLVTFLPETSHSRLPDTIQEGEMQGQGDSLYKSCQRRRSSTE